jgi:hypothetical protein
MTVVTGPARTAGSAATLDVTIVNVTLHPLATVFDAPLATMQSVAAGPHARSFGP